MVRNFTGSFLYYALAVDSTMLVALIDLASTQTKAIDQTYNDVVWLLNYAASHLTFIVRYNKIDMILQVHSDVSYLSVTKASIRAGRYPYLIGDIKYPLGNVSIHNV